MIIFFLILLILIFQVAYLSQWIKILKFNSHKQVSQNKKIIELLEEIKKQNGESLDTID